MRIRLTIPDDLALEVQTRAATSGRTFDQVVEDAIRTAFARPGTGRQRLPLPVHRGGRLGGGVSLDSGAALLDHMER